MFTSKKLIHHLLFMLILSIVLFFVATLITKSVKKYNSIQNVVKRLNSEIIQVDESLNSKIEYLAAMDLHKKAIVISAINKEFDNSIKSDGTEFLIYKNDSLSYWTNNSFSAPFILDSENFISSIVKSGNGYYLTKQKRVGDFVIVGLYLIKYNYKFENDYLPKKFGKGFKASAQVEISLKKNGNDIKDKEGKFLFSISYKTDFELSDWLLYLIFAIYLSSLLFFISAIFFAYMYFMRDFGQRWFLLLTFIADVFVIRIIQFYYKFPADLYQTQLFSPAYFASSVLLPSLGDFLINAALLLQVTYLVFKYHNTNKLIKGLSNWKKIIWTFILIGSVMSLFVVITNLVKGLILNSSIIFRFENILSLHPISHLAIAIISILLLVFLIYSIIVFYLSYKALSRSVFLGFVLFWLVSLFIYLFAKSEDYLSVFIAATLYFSILYFQIKKICSKYIKIGNVILLLVVLTAFATYIINSTDSQREKSQRILYASHLADARDNLAEFFFSESKKQILNDKSLISDIQSTSNDNSIAALANTIKQKYFSGYWDKYQILITVCRPNKTLNVQPGNFVTGCDEYFESYISNQMRSVSQDGLYFLRQSIDAMYYLGKIPIVNENLNPICNIYVEISSNEIWKGIGYPELLVDKKLAKLDNLSDYSYAYYYKNELIKNVGKYSYNIDNKSFTNSSSSKYIQLNGYSHLVYSPDKDTQIILSREELEMTDLISPFSYIFLILIVILFIIRLLSGPELNFVTNVYTFRLRLQLIMVSVILVSSLIIVGSSLLFINQLNTNKNKEILNEKLNSVLVELEAKYSTLSSINQISKSDAQEILVGISNTYFTDVNIYKTNGYLFASSREKVFTEGMLGAQINPSAAKQLWIDNKTFFIQNERIGNYNFLSAYAPIRNMNNQLIGFLNLPYFARQEEITREISGLITAFANIYIIMIVLTILLALLLSRLITKPLQHIGDQFSKVRLANSNAKIEWTRKDEIGRLVDEYNRMIDEMARSTELLARSERESAWRQMAKQVAHEIKNPLTPIKLSMQLLLRAWQDQAPDWESRLKRFSQTLIMQIDTLSSIATEFSDFAQMPEPEIQRFDVIPLIQQSTALYRDQADCEIYFDTQQAESYIKADPNQVLRVFNNLIKNALQAIPQEKSGVIRIKLVHENGKCLITFQDNGTGIPTEKQTRIFSPNFTTKSTGMGLGLAMVKNIIDSSGGRIWFETNPGDGTTFYVTLLLDI